MIKPDNPGTLRVAGIFQALSWAFARSPGPRWWACAELTCVQSAGSLLAQRAFFDPCRRRAVFLAIVDFATTAADRAAALSHLDAEHDRIRAMSGNLAFRVYASQEDENGVTIVHEWEDEASFDDYLASGSFARFGEMIRPITIGTPVSRRFRAELVATVA